MCHSKTFFVLNTSSRWYCHYASQYFGYVVKGCSYSGFLNCWTFQTNISFSAQINKILKGFTQEMVNVFVFRFCDTVNMDYTDLKWCELWNRNSVALYFWILVIDMQIFRSHVQIRRLLMTSNNVLLDSFLFGGIRWILWHILTLRSDIKIKFNIFRGFDTSKRQWPTGNCQKSSNTYKWEQISMSYATPLKYYLFHCFSKCFIKERKVHVFTR